MVQYRAVRFKKDQIATLYLTMSDIVHYKLLYLCPRTTDTQTEFFFKNPKLLGLGRQIGPKSFGAFGVFSAKLSALILVQ